MRILISNDDGFQAPGIVCLADALSKVAQITVVAPDRDRSGASNSLTLDTPIRATTMENDFIQVGGTPTDCVHLAITGLLEEEPDMVVSGINSSGNMGDDVLYSGTVAAAMEGRFLGFPAIAVSLVTEKARYYETAAQITVDLLTRLQSHPLPSATILNVNVPDLPYEQIKGLRVTRLGHRHKSEPVIRQQDPRGRPVYWVGPAGAEQDAGEGTDFYAVRQGFVSITPLHTDLTHHAAVDQVGKWIQSGEIRK
ncbi:MAG: 5'/3'-nucleotidase SurE [Gammaproteobacteria bacterium]